jgi:hypothetical protein
MSKPAVLLIGGVTHVQKEWEECASFAQLKVSFSSGLIASPGGDRVTGLTNCYADVHGDNKRGIPKGMREWELR